MRITYEAKGLIGLLDKVSKKFDKNVGELIKESASFASTELRGRFKKEIDPSGKKWANLAESTIRDKQKKGYGGKPILVRKGDLRESVQPRKKSKTKYEVKSVSTSQKLRMISEVQQSGSRTNRIPARPFVGITKETREGVKGLTEKYIIKVLRGL